jgi:hypothetical protein
MHGQEFQSNKCTFGDPDRVGPQEYILKIPNLPNGIDFTQAGVPYPEIVVTQYVILQRLGSGEANFSNSLQGGNERIL